jgi:hypothetical protein
MSELKDIVKHHKFLRTYLEFTGIGESPDAFNLWCAITGVSATLSRKFYFPHGNNAIYPNMYTIIVGAPGSRKTTAVNTLQKLIIESTNVRFAPTDIAGMRQGLLSALIGDDALEDEFFAKNKKKTDDANATFDADFSGIWDEEFPAIESPEDKSSLFICAGELQSFLGIKSMELVGCLGNMYDNLPEYRYQLKTSSINITDPTINLLGAITPNSFFECMPDGTLNSGFLSRFMMVASNEPRRYVPRMAKGNDKLRQELINTFRICYTSIRGELQETSDAMIYIDKLYTSFLGENFVNDARFQYYIDRRHDHFYKLLMCLVASDGRMLATEADAVLANNILIATEKNMAKALGEYGASKDSKIKQRIVEYINNEHLPVQQAILVQQFRNDLKPVELGLILEHLVKDKKITLVLDYFSTKTHTKGTAYAKI